MFLQGNPFAAAGSLVRYHYWAKDEEDRVSIAEQMGYANNPFSNNELIAALNDPSFNVRYEAIVAIAHSRPDPELIDALLLTLGGNEPDLSIHAAWAIGRLGDKSAIIALRETLESDLPLLRARSARALATLGDTHSIERLLHYFRTETNPGLRIAYAQGLGKMRTAVAIDEMLEFFATLDDKILRAEMALAIGRIVGNEKEYISLLREFEHDKNTAAAQSLLAMERELSMLPPNGAHLAKTARHCSKAFASGDFENAIPLLKALLIALPTAVIEKPLAAILADCARRLEQFGAARSEYILLSIHTLNTAIKKSKMESPPL
jgi:HEAT repeat protein